MCLKWFQDIENTENEIDVRKGIRAMFTRPAPEPELESTNTTGTIKNEYDFESFNKTSAWIVLSIGILIMLVSGLNVIIQEFSYKRTPPFDEYYHQSPPQFLDDNDQLT